MKKAAPRKSILVIDDDQIFCQAIKDEFETPELEVLVAHAGMDGLQLCRIRHLDVILLDQNLPDIPGNELCPKIIELNEQAKIIFISAFPSFDNAVKALKAGAHDYLSKPFELEELHLVIEQSFRILGLEKSDQLNRYRAYKEKQDTVLIGNFGGDGTISKIIDVASTVDTPVLITGETGTGKNVVAKSIHYKWANGNRDAPFFSINCSALPENLIEAELFGYEKGAFTGAVSGKKGIFEMADGGTLFLDEIGAMPLHLQSKLLGALDDGTIKRLGGQSMVRANPRIIAATNADLEKMIEENSFRQDLYFRLSVLRMHLPPLRERVEDIPQLCEFFLRKLAGDRQVNLPDSEIKELMNYRWPGNIRELKNIIERSLLLQKDKLSPSAFLGEPKALSRNKQISGNGGPRPLAEMELEHIQQVLHYYSGNLTRSARALGISLSTLKRKTKEYGLR